MKKPRIKKLQNGLTVMTIPVESPSLTVMTLVHTGSRFESKENNGISHFLEHMCFKGTQTQSGKQIVRYLDGLGAETNAFTSYELTGYYVKSITKHWKKTLAMVADIYQHSTFPEEEIQKEKGVIIGEISMYEDMPMQQVHDLFSALVYGPNHPAGFSILGPKNNINTMTRNDFLNYHAQHYVAQSTVVVVAGDITHHDVVREIELHFSSLTRGKVSLQNPVTISQRTPRIAVQHKSTDQTHVIFGYQTVGFHHKDTMSLKVLGSLLGGGMSSRLFERLREDMGVGYYVNARNVGQSDTGIFEISCGIDSTRVIEVLSAIQEEVLNIAHSGVTQEELKKTQEYIIGNTNMALEATDDVAYYYGQRQLFGLGVETPNQFAQKIKSITSQDLKRVAKKYFIPERLNVAMIGPHTERDKKRFITALKKTTIKL